MAGNPWDNDPIVTPGPQPAPAGGNPWDNDPIVQAAPAKAATAAPEAGQAGIVNSVAANAALSAAGGPLNPLIGAMAASALPGAVAGAAPLLKTAGAFMLKNGMGAYGTYKLLQDIAGGHFTAEHAQALLAHLESGGE